MTISFVPAIENDLEVCLPMIEAFYSIDDYPFDPNSITTTFLEFISNKELGRFWLIKHDQDIVGYLIFTFGYSFEYAGRDAFIDELYLKEPFRGQGIGSQILTTLDEEARNLKVNAIHLEVENKNERGQKLYTKSGFKGNDRSLLTKKLNA